MLDRLLPLSTNNLCMIKMSCSQVKVTARQVLTARVRTCHISGYDGPGPSNVRAPPQQFNNVPVMGIPPDLKERLVPFRIFKEGILYRLPRALAPAAPPLNPPVSQKRQREAQQYADRPYIKKPPNAFMLFRKEQRPNVVAELNITESATVNTILGQRWQAMSKEQQAKYFEEADRERQLHEQRYPDWSPKDNYGKKKKRIRTKDSTLAEASASKPDEVTQQAKKQCVTPVQIGSDGALYLTGSCHGGCSHTNRRDASSGLPDSPGAGCSSD
ncbi:transcription factor 7-like 1-B isoform X3 [Lates calcarifer]|uniref:Transcription factor 7-like 1-B isoform X3 n=1 Tax=Lates calcarifer TaxID=8187 RepID=A0AAJ7PCQ6_LATCA|nr:transcription factor 7-like 1-B isoform X3 [Lates calcarifer]